MVLDRRHVRATALPIAVLAMVAIPSTASATPEPGAYKLPSQIVIETQEHPGPNDPGRCTGQVFIEFPHIRNAVSYAVTVDDLVFNFDGTRGGHRSRRTISGSGRRTSWPLPASTASR